MNALAFFLLAISSTMAQLSIFNLIFSRDITCVKVGADATATWVNAMSQTCTWTGTVGANLGINAINGGDYGCMGRCGAGCQSLLQRDVSPGDLVDGSDSRVIDNVYTLDCFSHDVCSYFNNARGGLADKNCGKAFMKAVDDTSFASWNGCGQENPNPPVTVPSQIPVCI